MSNYGPLNRTDRGIPDTNYDDSLDYQPRSEYRDGKSREEDFLMKLRHTLANSHKSENSEQGGYLGADWYNNYPTSSNTDKFAPAGQAPAQRIGQPDLRMIEHILNDPSGIGKLSDMSGSQMMVTGGIVSLICLGCLGLIFHSHRAENTIDLYKNRYSGLNRRRKSSYSSYGSRRSSTSSSDSTESS